MQISSHSSEETEQIGRRLAANLHGGEVIELVSDLGGGKTTLTKGIVTALGSSDHVSSPTFIFCKIYKANNLTVRHYDFYRLDNAGLLGEEVSEIFNQKDTINIVEWADAIKNVLPKKRIIITISKSPDIENTRILTIKCPEGYSL